MTTPRTRRHIANFLAPIDLRGGLLQSAETIVDFVHRSRTAQASFNYAIDWVKEQLDILDVSYQHTGSREEVLSNSTVTTLLAIGLLRAEGAAHSGRAGTGLTIRQLLFSPKTLKRLFAQIEAGFLKGLVIEAEARAKRDHQFAHKLNRAVEDIHWLTSHMIYLVRPLASEQPDSGIMRYSTNDGIVISLVIVATIFINVISIGNWLDLDDKGDDDDDDDDDDSNNGDDGNNNGGNGNSSGEPITPE